MQFINTLAFISILLHAVNFCCAFIWWSMLHLLQSKHYLPNEVMCNQHLCSEPINFWPDCIHCMPWNKRLFHHRGQGKWSKNRPKSKGKSTKKAFVFTFFTCFCFLLLVLKRWNWVKLIFIIQIWKWQKEDKIA